MWKPIVSPLVFVLACGGDAEPTSDSIWDCACGSELNANDAAKSFDDKLAELSEISCGGVPALRGECSDGKSVLYINGGFGHNALYYVAQQLVGNSQSSDIYMQDCPSNSYGGALEDVTCELVSAEPLCPSSPYPGVSEVLELPVIPFADGQLSPWCEPQ